MRNICKVNECDKDVVAYNLCDKHRKRLSRHGHLKKTRPSDWGTREKHPLYGSWNWMRRMRGKHSICTEWDDFWQYVNDMGERPSPQHRIKRIDKHVGYSNENCKWEEVKPNQDRAEYAKQWRKDNPEKIKNNELVKMFGITLEDYNRMLKDQDSCCKICGKHSDDERQALAVDHCHTTGNIRGLLCKDCNTGLGLLKDSIPILQKAIEYMS